MRGSWRLIGIAAGLAIASACTTPQAEEEGSTTESTGSTEVDGGSGDTDTGDTDATDTGTGGTSTGGTGGTSLPALVNVNLENVLNDLSVALSIDRANIPVNAQVPVTVAANVCGVSVTALGATAGNPASCTATTTSPQLVQIVQQQIAAGGDVGGGDQSTDPPESNFM